MAEAPTEQSQRSPKLAARCYPKSVCGAAESSGATFVRLGRLAGEFSTSAKNLQVITAREN